MPTPTITINLPAEEFINENFDFSVVFDNTSTTDVGYGPFFDLVVPDEITLGSANYLGAPITLVEYEWNGTQWERGGTPISEHPYDTNLALPTAANTGDKWYLVELPFGSFVPEQPEAEITFSGNTLSYDEGARVGTPLEIQSRGGFRYGDDEFDTPDDATQEGSTRTSEITPKVIELTKTSDAPEKERSTGENFPVLYTLTVDIANSETVENLVISDVLPNNMEFLEFVDIAGGTVTQAPTTGAPANGNSFTIDLGSRTGTTSDQDLVITYRAYAPEFDANSAEVIDANSGDDEPSLNESQVTGNYRGTPVSDATTDAVGDEDDPADYELTLKSIAIQKGVNIVGGGDAVPGKVLEYTLDFQISDYFSFKDINIEDIFSDGQRLDSGFAPTLQIFGNDGTTGSTSFDNFTGNVNNNFSFDNLTGTVDTGTPGTSTGQTTLNFNVSQELIDSAVDADGILVGDEAGFGDDALGQGGTTGRIVYRTIIQDEFTDLHNTAGFSGDQSVDLDDSLNNTVEISGTIVDDDASSLQDEADGSSAFVPIATPTQSKTIYAIDGVLVNPADAQTLTPGQTVTYRLTMELPAADAENLVITDFLPLPVFDALEIPDGTVVSYSGVPPAAGTISFGPDHDLATILPSTANPTIDSTGGSSNTLAIDFGSFDDSQNRSATIDLLLTVTATDAPFVDGLFLTNQAQSQSGNTQSTVTNATEIVQIELTQPELQLTKGVVSENNPNDGTYDPGAPTAFNAPGSGTSYTGGINSNNLDTANIDSNLSGVDAGDLVTFAIVVENTGGSGAFDLLIQDAIPVDDDGNPQFQLPTGGAGLNLQVFNGNGSTVSFTGNLFSGGISIDDDANGVIDRGRTGGTVTGDGSNLLIITYDLEVLSTAESNEPLTSTAQILEYSAIENGNDYTNGVTNDDWVDPATVTIDTPAIAKTLVGTDVTGTNNNLTDEATIGETLTYQIQLTVPEGVMNNAQIVDSLDRGLEFISLDSVSLTSGSGVTTSLGTNAIDTANFSTSTSGNFSNRAGQQVTIDLGTLTNLDTTNTTPEVITLEYTVRVADINNNRAGRDRNNSAEIIWDRSGPTPIEDSAQNVTIVEPVLEITNTVVVQTPGNPADTDNRGDAGDDVTYTVTITHTGGPDAFEAALSNQLPDALNLGSAAIDSVTTGIAGVDAGDFEITAAGLLQSTNPFDIPVGESVTITVTGTLANTVSSGGTSDSQAFVTWTSLDGDVAAERTSYADDSTTSIEVFAPEPIKSIVSTSEDHTTGSDVAVGEIVRYRLVVQLSEGTDTNFHLRDNLPDGLQFINDSTTKIAILDISGTNLTVESGLTGAIVGASDPTSVTPTFDMPGDRISTSHTTNEDTYNSGTDVIFQLGDITNTGENSGSEFVVLEFNALVVNEAGVQALDNSDTSGGTADATDLDNTFSVFANDSTFTTAISTSDPVTVSVVEPVVDLNAAIEGDQPSDAGDQFTYRLTVTNNGDAEAFDLVLTDALGNTVSDTFTELVSITPVGGTGSSTITDTNTAGDTDITLGIDSLAVGQTLTFDVVVELTEDVGPGQVITNDADVTYTSLPGDGTASNATGSDPTSAATERDGADASGGALDDFADTASVSTDPLETPTITKAITATSETATGTAVDVAGNEDVAIGEIVTYQLTVTVPEGTTDGLVITDEIPDGLQLVGTPTLDTTGFSGTVGSLTPGGGSSNGEDVTFSLGQIVADSTAGTAGNTFTIEYQAVVLDVPSNDNDTAPLGDRATFQFTNPNDGSTVTNQPVTGEPEVDVVVPDLNITQTLTINGTQAGSGDAGDTVTIRLEVENTGDATAFEVALNDLLDETKFDIGSATATTTPSGFSFSNSTGTAGEVTFSGGDIPVNAGTPLVFEFTVPLLDAVEPGETLTSEANITKATTIDGTPTSGIERDIADPDIEANDQSLTIDGPTLATRLVETEIDNDTDAGDDEAAIGELVTYELTLTIPEGTTPSAVLSDTLDPGLAFVGFTSINLGGATSTTIADVDDLNNAANDSGNTTVQVTNDGSDIAIDLGNLLNTGDNAGDQTITIQYQAVVENIATNQGDGSETSPTLNNDPSFSWDNGTVQTIEEAAPSANVTVIEPDLQIVKDVVVDGSGTAGDGGDSVVYTITIEHTGDSTADAFDLNLTDALPPEFVPDGSPIAIGTGNTSSATAGDFEIASGTNTLGIVFGSNIDLDLGEVLVLEIRGTIPDTVETGDTADSTATVTWTSLDGEVSDRSTHTATGDEERTGAGGDNDYTASDNAEFTITGAPEITTELVGSQLDNGVDNGNADAVPGELVTFRTTITVPEGTTSGVELKELLDPGLAFVEITNVSTSLDVSSSTGLDLNDATAANTAAAVGTNGSDFTLNLGNVVNSASSDGSPETIVIEYTAVVLNDAANQSTDNETGPTLNNTATLDWTNNPTPGTPISATSAEEVSVVEPQLEVIKDVVVNGSGTEGDAGDPVVYTITIEHTGDSEADAFDVNLSDVLPAGFVPDADAISVTNNTTGNSIQNSDFEISGGTLQVAYGSNIDIPENTLITLTVSGTFGDSVQSGEEINSPAEITWTSIDGDATDLSTSTRNGDEERTGADGEGAGLNNYAHSDDAPVTITGEVSIAKSITDTSEPDSDTSGTNVAIGEVVTYQIAVTIPEGSTEGIVVTDDLRDGMQLTGTPTIIDTGLEGSVSALTTSGGTSSGDPITFNINTATATGDNDTGNNTFIIEYQAVVLDEPGNVDTTELTGDAQLVHNDATGNPITTPIEAPTEPTVTVVEPVLEIVQTLALNGETATNADTTVPSGDAGDTVTITLDVTNNGTGGAFEVEIQDLLDPAKFDLSTVNFVTTPDGTGNVNADGISYTGVDIAAGETQQFVFAVELNDGVSPGETLNNVATIIEGNTIDETPTSGVERDIADPDIDSNPEALVINEPMLETRLVQTEIDNPNNGNTEAAIGELATYELTLTIPEGTTPSAVLSDALDSGLTFVEFTNINFDGVDAGNVTDLTSLTNNTTVAANGTGFDIDLGDLVSNNVDGTPETITIQYTAAVSNDAANQGDASETSPLLNNDPSFSWNGRANSIDDPVAPSQEISVIEPQLEVIKDVVVNGSGTQGDAGDPIVYTITIQHTGDSTSDAFDVNLTDVLPPGFVPDGSPFSIGGGNTATVNATDFEIGAGNTLQLATGSNIDIAQGEVLVLEVSGTLADSVQSGEEINSPAEITWTSIDGDATDLSDHTTIGDTERTGADGEGAGLNNYAHSDDAPATVTGEVSIAKTITDTSEPNSDTSGTNVAIGEVVTYQIAVTIPEGSTEGIVVTDDLLPGLALTGTPTVKTDGLQGSVTTLNTSGGSNSGDPIIFSIDTATATGDNDTGNNTFIIEYQAVVLDEPGNVDTTELTGDAQLVHNDATGNPIATPIEAPTEPTVTVVEPVLEIIQTLELNAETATNANDVVPSGDAGDTVTITLDVSNTGTGGAFEVEIQDLLDPGKFDLSTVNFVTTPDGTGNVNADGISYTGVDVAVGETQQFVFTVELADGVSPGETLNNVATIVEGNTIDETPTSGVERDIADPDIDSNPEALVINGPMLETRLIETEINDANNGNTEAAIGELATYELTLTIPEGTTPSAVLNDAFDSGLAFVEFTNIELNGITSTTVSDLASLNTNTTVGNDGTGFNINLGDLLNAGDQDGDRSITIQYTAVVLNDAANQGETPSALNNDPSFSWNSGADTIDDPLAPSEEISVVEPQLTIQTEVLEDPTTPQENVRRNIGDTVRVRLTLSSDDADAFSSDAYDVALSNALPPGVTFAGNLAHVSGVAPNAGTLTESGGTVNATFDTFPDGSESVIEFDVTLDGTVTAGDITDTAQITYSSVPGDPGTISTHNAASTERTGDGTGNNDYFDDDPASITVNQPPETDDVEEFVAPEETINVLNMGGNDTDGGTVDEFRIDTLPDRADGILYLGDPAMGGTPIDVNDIIPAAQIGNLYFEATPGFDGGEFTYSAIDNEGGIDLTPNTVTLTPNIRPETVDAVDRVPPEGTINVEGMGGSDPDGTVVEYGIASLPGDGTLFLGDPASGGTPVQVGDRIPAADIDDLHFTASPGFTGTSFTYFSVDNEGATDLTPATVTIDSNPRPETNDVINNVPLSSNVPLTGLVGPLGGSDPNGIVDEYRIVSVPDAADGILYLGDPAYGGTPLSANDTVPAGQINNLFFQSTGTFDGATFQYAAIDDEGAEDLTPATVTLNAPPETIDSNGTVPPNGTIQIENLGGSDPDTMVQFYTIDSLPPAADGTLYLGSATPGNEVQVGDNLTPVELGQLFFTASPTFTGDTTFTYHATDDLGLPDATPATVTITSIDGNVPPETIDNLQTIEPGTTVPLPVPPGSDFDGTVTGYQIDTLPEPEDGVLTLNGTPVTAGQVIPTNQIGNLVFEATPEFDGGEFTYSAVDNEGDADPTPATYTLNAPPTTEDVDDRVNPDDTLPLTALIGNDPDGTVASYTIDTLPPAADGILYLGDPAAGGTPVTAGQVIPASDIDDLFFTASGTFTGTNFTYSATDDNGITDATPATVTLTPDGVNLAPQTENIEDTVDPGDTLNLVGLMGSDPDGTVEEFRIDTLPEPEDGILYLGDPAAGGTPVNVGDIIPAADLDDLFFEATPEFDGTTFTYSAIDNLDEADPSPATVTLNPTNIPPETEDGIQTVQPGSPNLLDVPGGTDDDGTVTGYQIDTLPDPADGILYIGDPSLGNTVSAGQTLTPTQLEQLVFVAEPGFDGGEFTYSAIDNDGVTDPTPATFTLNAPPETVDFTGNVNPNDTLNLTNLGGSDPDATGSVVSYTIDTLPPTADGILYLGDPAAGGIPVTAGQVIPPADLDDLFFEASGTFTGTSFTYSATDNTGADDPTPATVNLIPDGANVPPTTDDVEDTVAPGDTLNIPDLGGDDPDGTVDEYQITFLPTGGTLYLGDPTTTGVVITQEDIDDGFFVDVADIDDLHFIADPDFTGTTFTYTAIDNEGDEDPTPATVTLNVPPETDDGAQEVTPGTAATLVGLGGDDLDGTVEGFRIDSLPTLVDGVLYLGSIAPGNEIFPGQVLTPAQIDQLVFDATNDFDGASFTYSAIDNDGAVDPTPATFDLVPPNDPPDTDDVTDNIAPEETINLTGLSGSDTDGTIAYYTITSLPPGDDGILYIGDPEVDGVPVNVGDVLTPEQIEQLYFEASPTYSGTSFTYAAADDDGASDPTPGTVTLGLGNLPPETDDAINEVEEETTTLLTGLGGNDPDGTIDFYTIQTLPSEGTLYLGNPASGGTPVSIGQTLTPFEITNLYFDAPTGYSGDSNFNYIATDEDGEEDPTLATVFLPTPDGNLPPDTEDTSATALPEETIQLTGLGGNDVDGGTVEGYEIQSLPTVGTLYVDDPENGLTEVEVDDVLTPEQIENLFYEAPTGFTGDTTFEYAAIDDAGAVDPTPGTITISALSDNVSPDTDNASASVPPGGSVSLPGLGGSDTDGTVALYQINTLPSQGTLYIGNPSLGVTVTPGQILTPTQLEQLVFQAPRGFSGSSFTYSTIDNEGGIDPTPATVTLSSTVIPVSPPPFVIGGGNSSPTPTPTPQSNEPTVANGDREEPAEPTEPEPTEPTPQTHPVDPNCVDCCPDAPELEGVYVAPPEALTGAPVPPPPTFDSTAFIPVPETIFNGGDGNDSIEGTIANDELQGFEGDDRLEGSNGDDLIVGGISSPTPVGDTRDRDYLAGNQGRDFISASEGNDTVYGGENADVVLAGKDNDRVWGDRGDDTLLGELGDDTISGDSQDLTDGELSGRDLIYGGAGNDRLNGNEKNDTVSGGDGDDFARGGQDDDLVYGDGGNDTLYGDYGNDTILGSLGSNAPIGHDEERDLLYGNQGRDLLKGGQGDDSIYAGQQDDLAYGGKDDDLILGELGSDTLSGDLGDDTIRGGTGDSTNPDLDGRDLIYGGGGNDAIYGNEGDDTITAGDGNDLARGGQNNDLIFGDGGNDTIHGEYGDDTILGSLGSSASASADDERDLLYGNQGSDLIKGGQGEDTVYAGKHEDLVYGGKDGDLIFGDQGSDTLSGDLGDDTIIGGTGNPSNPEEDTANDVIFGGDGRDLMDGNLGDDSIVSGSGNDIAFGGQGDDIIWGEAGNDILFGDLGNDTLCGGDGDDLLVGSNGNPNSTNDGDDRLCGGAGNDSLFGNEGNDTLVGEDGDDCMFGGQGDDTLKGGAGNDLLVGDRGNDLLIGGSGSDVFVLRVGDGSDVITDFEVGVDLLGLADGLTFEQLTITQGETGTVVSFGAEVLVTLEGVAATSITATSFTNRFKGQEPDEHDCPDAPTLEGATVEPIPEFTLETMPDIENVLIGNAGNDGIIGSDGNDSIRGLAGNDRADGEAGDDVLVGGLSSPEPVGSDMDRDTLYGNQGNDVILGSEGEDFLYGGKDGDVILGGKDNDEIEGEIGDDTLAGEWGDDRIFGGTGDADNPDTGRDLIYGGLGNDELYGNQGNDSISGGYGDDIAFGGKEDDLISGEYGNDTLEGEQGNDTILGSLGSSSGIGSNGDRDWLSGNIGNDLIKGGEGEDTVYAGKDDDLVYGGKDDDVIYGDLGRDTLSGDLGDDTISGGTGVNSNVEGEADADVIFGGDGNDLIDGNLGNDSIVAGTGNDTVSGGRQDDVIWGEAGDDVLFGDLGNDTVCGGEGNDTLIGSNGNPMSTNDGNDKLCGGAGNDVVFGNEGNDRISGDAGNDVLLGGRGDDSLTGGSGSDILSGEQGNDVLTGGAGADRFDFASNHGVNLITDFQDGVDRIGLKGGLTPDRLEIIQIDEHTQITAGDLTVVLSGVDATSIDSDDFSIL